MNSRFRRSRFSRDFGAARPVQHDPAFQGIDREYSLEPNEVDYCRRITIEQKVFRSDGRHATIHPAGLIRPPPAS